MTWKVQAISYFKGVACDAQLRGKRDDERLIR